MVDAQEFDRLLKCLNRTGFRGSAQTKVQIASNIQMIEKTGFLKDVANVPFPGRTEYAFGVVLPDLRPESDQSTPRPLEPCHTAQDRGLARTGWAEQHRDTAAWQSDVQIQLECTTVQGQTHEKIFFLRHATTRSTRFLSSARTSRTTKEKTTMPAASQWACSNSMASTWP